LRERAARNAGNDYGRELGRERERSDIEIYGLRPVALNLVLVLIELIVPSKSGKQKKKPHKAPGPKPEVLKIEDNWKEAIKKRLRKKYPEAGWP
jgi:hypothetical protein